MGGISGSGPNEQKGSKCVQHGAGALFQGFVEPEEHDRDRTSRATNARIQYNDPDGDLGLPSTLHKQRGDRFPDRNTCPLLWICPRLVRVLGLPRPRGVITIVATKGPGHSHTVPDILPSTSRDNEHTFSTVQPFYLYRLQGLFKIKLTIYTFKNAAPVAGTTLACVFHAQKVVKLVVLPLP